MIRLIKPKYLMPFHGDYRMLKSHANLGVECGIPKENTFVLQNGDVLSLYKHTITKSESIPTSDIYIDGNRLGEINSAVLRDRKIMASDGILVVIANIDMRHKTLLIRPNITTRGFVLINENEALIKKIESMSEKIITDKLKEENVTFSDIKGQLISELVPYIYELTGRKPIVLPVILDIRKEN